MASEVKSFGCFRLDPADHRLWRDDERVSITPKAYDVLRYLVEHPGRLVTPDEMLEAIWANTYVNPEVLRKYILEIRKALGDKPDDPQFVETVPKRGYRFIAPVSCDGADAASHTSKPIVSSVTQAELPSANENDQIESPPNRAVTGGVRPATLWRVGAVLSVLVVAVFIVGNFRRPALAGGLTDRDTVVLADFANTTGDAVFDGTLRQGLAAQLEQSPFLNMLSDRRIAQTLSLMRKPNDTPLSADVAREVCQRTTSAATIEGSIAGLGHDYVIGLKAINCSTGDVLSEEQVTADNKEQVLVALGKAATKLRRRLGESLASVQKYDGPAESVTTPSLEALQAYSAAVRAMAVGLDYPTTIRSLERAVQLDPDFAKAYEVLANAYSNMGENQRATESMTKAYALRDRVSERERLSIEANYQWIVNGDLEGARKTFEIWSATYPRDWEPATDLGIICANLGDYDRSLAAFQDALRFDPGSGLAYSNLLLAYTNVNRLADARHTAQAAQAHGLDTPLLRLGLYSVDFLEKDAPAMQQELNSQMGQAGAEDMMLFAASDSAAYSGQFAKARGLMRRATDSATRADEKETAATYQAQAAVNEALAGYGATATERAQAALAQSKGKDVEAMSAVALAMAGDSVQAKRLATDLNDHFPKDTIVRSIYIPTIMAAAHLHSGAAGDAINALAPSALCELGSGFSNVDFALYPPYFRGMAFLQAHNGNAAAVEFQKIVDHSALVVNEEVGSLAHLGLARAYALSGDEAKAKAAYQEFFTLWKDADPDVPILKRAKAEYAKLEQPVT